MFQTHVLSCWKNSSKPSRPPPIRASLSAPTVLQRPRVQSKLFLSDDTSKRWQEYRQKKGRFPIRTCRFELYQSVFVKEVPQITT